MHGTKRFRSGETNGEVSKSLDNQHWAMGRTSDRFGCNRGLRCLLAVASPATFEWNAVATLAVWVMTIFIQRTSRRDTLAIHAKLDELLRSHEQARSELAQLDEEEPEDIEEHRRSERRRSD